MKRQKNIIIYSCIGVLVIILGCLSMMYTNVAPINDLRKIIEGIYQEEIERNGVSVEDFIKEYASHSVDEDYYKYNDFDYNYLYNIEMDDIEDNESDLYDFCLLVNVFGDTTAEMKVLADEDDYIDSVFVFMEATALNLFETQNEIKEYYASILTSLDIGLTDDYALSIINRLLNADTLHNQRGIEKKLDVNVKLVINLNIYDDGSSMFQATLKK